MTGNIIVLQVFSFYCPTWAYDDAGPQWIRTFTRREGTQNLEQVFCHKAFWRGCYVTTVSSSFFRNGLCDLTWHPPSFTRGQNWHQEFYLPSFLTFTSLWVKDCIFVSHDFVEIGQLQMFDLLGTSVGFRCRPHELKLSDRKEILGNDRDPMTNKSKYKLRASIVLCSSSTKIENFELNFASQQCWGWPRHSYGGM